MKRIATIIILGVLMTTSASAQNIKLGVRGGLNITQLSLEGDLSDNINKSNRTGWFFGPSAKLSILSGLGADISLLYDQRNADVGSEGSESIEQKSINIPANLKLSFGLGSTTAAYIAFGPQIGFNVGDKKFDILDKEGNKEKFKLKTSNFSFNLGAGVTLLKHLEVGLAYNIPLGTTGEITWEEGSNGVAKELTGDTKTGAWQLGAAIYF